MQIIADFIPSGRQNRPALANPIKYITIHETDNTDTGADARAHAQYLKTTTEKVSWHYTVDQSVAYQHLPDSESAFHAGDGRDGVGNAQSIGIELCVNAGSDFEKTRKNAAFLVRKLMEKHGIPAQNIVQHNRWNGKDCPKTMRHNGTWASFLQLCVTPDVNEPSAWAAASWEKARQKGITDGLRPHDTCTREELITMLDRAGVLGK